MSINAFEFKLTEIDINDPDYINGQYCISIRLNDKIHEKFYNDRSEAQKALLNLKEFFELWYQY